MELYIGMALGAAVAMTVAALGNALRSARGQRVLRRGVVAVTAILVIAVTAKSASAIALISDAVSESRAAQSAQLSE
jgi:hypothetical protein